MSATFTNIVRQLTDGGPDLLGAGKRGIEKESLRICANGKIAQTPHPNALGSALTHRFITTDYSEALLEFVTPPQAHGWAAVQFLCDIHNTTYDAIGDELFVAVQYAVSLNDRRSKFP